MHSSPTEQQFRSHRTQNSCPDLITNHHSSTRRPTRLQTMPSGFTSLCCIFLFCCVFCLTRTEALPTQQHITDSSTTEQQMIRNRRALDTLDGDDFSLRKRALDTLDGDDFSLKRKRALDLMDGDGFSFEKRALDSLEGEGFGGFRKRALDSLEGDGFNGFNKRALDMLEGDGFAGFSKRSLDALEGNGFGLDKRVPSKTQHESRLRRAIDNLNRIRAQALAERLKRSTYNLRMQRTVKRALDALEGNDAFGF